MMIEALLTLTVGWTDLFDDIATMAARGNVPAGAVVFVDEGEVVLAEGFGTASAMTPFRVGSITKTVMALAALEASIDPDQVVVLPNVQNPFPAPVRLLHLLEHSAGLGELTRDEFRHNEPVELTTALSRRRDILSPPGLIRSYSNVNPGFTAHAIEVAEGRPYTDVVTARVFDPLGIKASFEPSDDLPGAFRADGETPIPYWHMTFKSMGALNMNARDFAQLLATLANDGRLGDVRVFRPDSIQTLFWRRSSPIETGYGAGTRAWVRDGRLLIGHGGDADGYRSQFAILPTARRGYFISINVDNAMVLNMMRTRIEQALVADVAAEPPPPAGADDLDQYVGRYYPARVRFGVERWRRGELDWFDVIERRGELVVRGNRTTRLIPLGEGRFRQPDDPVVSAIARIRGDVMFLTGPFGDIARLGDECAIEPPWPDDFLPGCLWR